MSAPDTKVLIANTFIGMVTERPYEKVRISGLIEACQVSRTAFYYHFPNKVSIAMWIFRTDLTHALQNNLPASKLITCPVDERQEDELPYYVHDEMGGHALDATDFFVSLSECLLKNVALYKSLLMDPSHEFCTQITLLYTPAIIDDLAFMLGSRYLPEQTKGMLIELSVAHIINFIRFIVFRINPDETTNRQAITPFCNYLHESLYNALRAHPMQRR